MTSPLLTADAFLAAAQAGQKQDAAEAADALLSDPMVEERTLAFAALTYLHAGRFDAAKKTAKKLEGAGGVDALWAKAAVAVAFNPKQSKTATEALAPWGAGTDELRLLAGVAAYQNGEREAGARLLDGLAINPMSVFATAATLGMRKMSNTGLAARTIQVAIGIVSLFTLGIIGLFLGLAGAEGVNRSRARRNLGPSERTLLELAAPKEKHNSKEVGRFVLFAVLVFAVIGLFIFVMATS